MNVQTTVARLVDGLRGQLRSLLGGLVKSVTTVVAVLFVGAALVAGAAAALAGGVALSLAVLTGTLLRLAPTRTRRVRRHPDGTIPV